MSDHYATIDDINALVPQVPFTATSRPTAATVNAMIDDVGNEIDAWLNTTYIVPVVSGASALQFLRNLCAWGALGRAQEARNTAVNAEAAGIKSVWTKKYEEYIKNTVDASVTFLLRDAPQNVDFIPKVASQIVDSNVLSYPDTDDHDEPRLGRPHLHQVL